MTEFDMTTYLNSHHLVCYILIVISSVCLTLITIPSILYVARARHLYDDSGHFRKLHDGGIPRLGGIGIFVSFTITLLLFGMTNNLIPINYLLTACIILFAMGIKDDLLGVNPGTKFFIQFVTGLILVVPGNIRLSSMYGLLGIYEISYLPSVMLSVLTIMFIVNSFNLIDGIDGLASITGIIVNSAFTALFIYMQQYELATITLAMAGAVLGFLKFNITPAKIFMGDTGSLLIGLISAVMAITFIEVNNLTELGAPVITSAPEIAIAILIGPISDTLRVFVIRIYKRTSPFKADRNHIHHRVLLLGFTHLQTTFILTAGNVLTILLVIIFTAYSSVLPMIFVLLTPLTFNWALSYLIRSKERANYDLRNLFV